MECWEMETNTFRCQSQSLVSGNVVSKSCCKEGRFCEEITVWLLTSFCKACLDVPLFFKMWTIDKNYVAVIPPVCRIGSFQTWGHQKITPSWGVVGSDPDHGPLRMLAVGFGWFPPEKRETIWSFIGIFFFFCNDICIYRIPLKINGWNLTIILFWQGTSSEPNLNFWGSMLIFQGVGMYLSLTRHKSSPISGYGVDMRGWHSGVGSVNWLARHVKEVLVPRLPI